MGYRSLREALLDLERHRHLAAGARGSRPASGDGGDPAPGLPLRSARASLRERQGLPLPGGLESLRDSRARPLSLPRFSRAREEDRPHQGRSRERVEEPARPRLRPLDRSALASEVRLLRTRALEPRRTSRIFLGFRAGPTTAAPSSPFPRSIRSTPTAAARCSRTSACTACSSRETATRRNEVGLHYQIHRGIGVHHAAAVRRGEPLRVSVFVGGPPAHTLAAVMPLPEGLTELLFAGMLNRRRFRLARRDGFAIAAEADFVITGRIDPDAHASRGTLRRSPRLLQPRPRVSRSRGRVGLPPRRRGLALHRRRAPSPGGHHVREAHPRADRADGSRVASRREGPPRGRRRGSSSSSSRDRKRALRSLRARRARAARDPHLRERHSRIRPGLAREVSLHRGRRGRSRSRRERHRGVLPPPLVAGRLPARPPLPDANHHRHPRLLGHRTELRLEAGGGGGGPREARAFERIRLRISASRHFPACSCSRRPRFPGIRAVAAEMEELSRRLAQRIFAGFPLVVLADDPRFTASHLRNFLWVTFTRSNPSHDVHGVSSFVEHKHWGCEGPSIIDARLKPHHAPPLIEDPEVTKRVDRLASKGGSLHGVLK